MLIDNGCGSPDTWIPMNRPAAAYRVSHSAGLHHFQSPAIRAQHHPVDALRQELTRIRKIGTISYAHAG
jgi:hypothetical protein